MHLTSQIADDHDESLSRIKLIQPKKQQCCSLLQQTSCTLLFDALKGLQMAPVRHATKLVHFLIWVCHSKHSPFVLCTNPRLFGLGYPQKFHFATHYFIVSQVVSSRPLTFLGRHHLVASITRRSLRLFVAHRFARMATTTL